MSDSWAMIISDACELGVRASEPMATTEAAALIDRCEEKEMITCLFFSGLAYQAGCIDGSEGRKPDMSKVMGVE